MSYAICATNKRPTIQFRRVVNLTNRHVGLYDAAGSIAICDPGCHSDLLAKLDPEVMVIVTDDSDVKAFGIPEENAVRVQSYGVGHNGNIVSRLFRPLDNAIVNFAPYALSLGTPDIYHA
ncbi:hypothetical protein IIZ77_01820 [Candidatus Saccharibacteria bacterium]|nr:hypothetical protein [Candidatus Saccharibacteria bacterium]